MSLRSATGTWRATGMPETVVTRFNPPYREAAALSGCPSISEANRNRSWRDILPSAISLAAIIPATTAAAEDPSPELKGISFLTRRLRPAGGRPLESTARRPLPHHVRKIPRQSQTIETRPQVGGRGGSGDHHRLHGPIFFSREARSAGVGGGLTGTCGMS